MQVTNQQDHVTHAVISGNQTISFGISNSPEFFQILSSTLYTNQKLAVVREVLCNAWDAHIAAGLTDRPIEIILEEDKLEIRDFGLGIPKDLIGQIYGTYGNSTKKNDGEQTGGFGLGCKAPFAYTDHFEVESFHQGTRTIYAISKSSAERNGLPGITPIVDLPTAESGLRVTVPLRARDKYAFEVLIKQVVWNGEISALLNQELLPTLEFSKAPSNWLIVRAGHLGSEQIHLRYGNVVYPLPKHPEYGGDYYRAFELLQKIRGGYSLILLAPPHSISVTPSREALSLQEHTIATLKGLLAGFTTVIAQDILVDSASILKERLRTAVTENKTRYLFARDCAIPSDKGDNRLEIIQTNKDLAYASLLRNYPNNRRFRENDIRYRLKLAIQGKLGDVGRLKELRGQIKGKGLRSSYHNGRAWYLKTIASRLTRALEADPVMDPAHLNILDSANQAGGERNQYGLYTLKDYKPAWLDGYIPLLRKIVVLTYSQADLRSKVMNFPEMVESGDYNGIFVYRAPYAKTKVQAMRDFFLKRKFTLLDLTVPQPWDPPKVSRSKPKEVKPKLEGYPLLSGAVDNDLRYRVDYCFNEGIPRLATPEFYLRVEYSRAEHRDFGIDIFRKEEAKAIVSLYGDRCVVVRTLPAEIKLKEAGVPELVPGMLAEITNEFLHDPKFQEYWKESHEIALGWFDAHQNPHNNAGLQKALHVPSVRKALGLKTHLDPADQNKLSIWQYANWLDHGSHKETLIKACEMFAGVKLSPKIANLRNTHQTTQLLQLIREDRLQDALFTATPAVHDRIATIIKAVFIG